MSKVTLIITKARAPLPLGIDIHHPALGDLNEVGDSPAYALHILSNSARPLPDFVHILHLSNGHVACRAGRIFSRDRPGSDDDGLFFLFVFSQASFVCYMDLQY